MDMDHLRILPAGRGLLFLRDPTQRLKRQPNALV